MKKKLKGGYRSGPGVGPTAKLADDAPKQRACLFCGKVFWSKGPGNRKCPACVKKG